MPPTMRVVMFWIILIIEFGLPSLYNTLYKAYEFLKSLFRPFRGKSHRTRQVYLFPLILNQIFLFLSCICLTFLFPLRPEDLFMMTSS